MKNLGIYFGDVQGKRERKKMKLEGILISVKNNKVYGG
jgi:hypothetical protein